MAKSCKAITKVELPCEYIEQIAEAINRDAI